MQLAVQRRYVGSRAAWSLTARASRRSSHVYHRHVRPLAIVVILAACAHAPPIEAPEPADDDPEDPSDALPVTAGADSASPRAALLAEAHRELAAMVESHYAHHTHVVEAAGAYDFDCSGFVGYALARAAPNALQPLVAATRARPLAEHFEAFFAAPQAPWTRVDRAADLVPGDVIAWLEPPAKHSRNTGHVMIVARAPVAEQPGELVVDVIDSSHSGHGTADARIRDHRNGLGTGALILLVDPSSGRASGYRWSRSRHSIAYTTDVALGHLP